MYTHVCCFISEFGGGSPTGSFVSFVLRDLWRPGWREADATSSEPRAPSAASQRAGLEWVRRMVQLSVRAEKERDARIAATSFDHNLLVP